MRRRTLLTSAGAGVLALSGCLGRQVEEVRLDDCPEFYTNQHSGAPTTWDTSQAIHHTHQLELEAVAAGVEAFNRDGKIEYLCLPSLRHHLRNRSAGETVNLEVSTIGKRVTTKTNGPLARTIHGYAPTREEVEMVAQYGTVAFVPEFINTTISLHDVAVADVEQVARLPVVTAINAGPKGCRPLSCEAFEGSSPSAERIRTAQFTNFAQYEAADEWQTSLRFGIVDTGYTGEDGNGDPAGIFGDSPAEEHINHELSSAFNDPYHDTSDGYHGTNVTNTAAQMINGAYGPGSEYVILRVNDPFTIREAIEFAEKESISVLNISMGEGPSSELYASCPGYYCGDLYQFQENAGYSVVAATGNNSNSFRVAYPACSYFTIGVGGAVGSCRTSEGCGYRRYQGDSIGAGSNFGEIGLGCYWCGRAAPTDSHFQPDVYGVWRVTGTRGAVGGSSVAAPQVAACVWKMIYHTGHAPSAIRRILHEMDTWNICPEATAQSGQLLDVAYAYEQLTDEPDC